MELNNRKFRYVDFVRIPFSCALLPSLAIVFFVFSISLLPLLQVLAISSFVDTAVAIFSGSLAYNEIFLPLGFLIALMAYTGLSGVINNHSNRQLDMRLRTYFRVSLIEKRAKLSYEHMENNDTLEIINRVCDDSTGNIMTGFSNCLQVCMLIIQVSSLLIYIMLHVWWAGLAVLVFALPLFFLALRLGKKNYDAYVEAEKYERRANYFQNVLLDRESADERNLFGYGKKVNKRWSESYYKSCHHFFWARAKSTFNMKGASIITLVITLLIVGILTFPLVSGALTLGIFIGLTNAAFSLVNTICWDLWWVTYAIALSRERIKDLTAFFSLSEKEGALDMPQSFQTFESIEFRDVSFRYPGTDTDVLSHLDLTITADKNYAIVGANGSGKTTLTKLLTGLYDKYEGDIFINGKSLKEYSLPEIKGMFSVVYQDFARYYVSVKDNVAFGNYGNFDDAGIEGALISLEMNEVVDKLPQKIHTPLGKIKQGGVDLSGGEWQRVALARSLISSAPINILDEPTAALDPIVESRVYELYGKISEGKTTIFITHRLGAARLADEIIVIAGGKVVEKGSHAALMESEGLYSTMFESQRSWYL